MSTRYVFRAFILALLFGFTHLADAAPLTLESPDKNLRIQVNIDKDITWSLDYRGKQVITPSKIGLHYQTRTTTPHCSSEFVYRMS